MKILFVCTGNTCRSPMAEYIMKNAVKKSGVTGIKISSAGTRVTENDINSEAVAALKKIGLRVRKFTPRQISAQMIKKQDIIVCMTKEQKLLIDCKRCLSAADITGVDIPDPYGLSLTEYCETAAKIAELCKTMISMLSENDNNE